MWHGCIMTENKERKIVNRDLLLPYGVPYFAYVGIASLGAGRISDELGYVLKIIIVPLLLVWAWKWIVPLTGPKKKSGSILYGIGFGLIGTVLWCVTMLPFLDESAAAWSRTTFLLLLFSASLIVPVFEELFVRGYIFRAAYQWDKNRKNKAVRSAFSQALDQDNIQDVPPGAWSIAAILISSVCFTLGHHQSQWLAAMTFSFLICILWVIRKDLLSCVVAHGITNFTLAIYVYYTGQWGLW